MVTVSQPSGKHKCLFCFVFSREGWQHVAYCTLGESGLWLECDTTSRDVNCFCAHACVCVNFTYVRWQDVRGRCRQALGAACHLANKQQLFGGEAGLIHARLVEDGRWMYFFICVNSHS